MPNYASLTLVGHLGKDPQTKTLNDGQAVTSFSIATSRKRANEEITTWWNCSLWGKRGDALARYLKKGDPVLVHGEPYLRKYTTNDGQDGVSLDVVCSDFAFIGGKSAQEGHSGDSSGQAQSSHQPSARTAPAAPYGGGAGNDDDDIPFDMCQRGWAA